MSAKNQWLIHWFKSMLHMQLQARLNRFDICFNMRLNRSFNIVESLQNDKSLLKTNLNVSNVIETI